MDIQTLYEFIGAINPQSAPSSKFPGGPSPTGTPNTTISVDNCARLFGWQQIILNQLRTGQDIYTIVSPGGGKTSPIVCYWIHHILKINTLRLHNNDEMRQHVERIFFGYQNLDKLVYLVPTRQLAEQTVNDLLQIMGQILSQLMTWYFLNSDDKDIKLHFSKLFLPWLYKHYSGRNKNYFKTNDEITLLIKEIKNAKYTSGNISSYTSNSLKIFQEIIETSCSNFLNTSFLYIQTGGRNTNGNPINFPVIITIYQSADSGQLLNVIKHNKTKLIICDESHTTQNLDPLFHPSVDQKQAQDIALSLYTVLSNKTNNAQLAFLSGTQNPESAKLFAEFISSEFPNIKFNISNIKSLNQRNRAQIEIIEDNTISTNTGIINNIVRQIQNNDWGNLYILFSSRIMKLIIEECIKKLAPKNLTSIDRLGKQEINFTSYLNKRNEKNKRYSSYNDMKFSSQNIAKPSLISDEGHILTMEARNIQNPFLRLAVSHGIGYIARNLPIDNHEKLELSESDKFIIQNLFTEKKIKVLLATDAVGVGVNISVKNLFIASTQKFSGNLKRNEEIILRDLSQILNRAGRSAIDIAGVYTPSENYDRVMLALTANPEQFELSQIVQTIRSPKKMGKQMWQKTYLQLKSLAVPTIVS